MVSARFYSDQITHFESVLEELSTKLEQLNNIEVNLRIWKLKFLNTRTEIISKSF